MKKRETALELMTRLDADPAFVAARERKERAREAREAGYRQIEAPLVAELRARGFAVDSAWDLVNTALPYVEALPVLLDHLRRPYPGPVKEGIARALALPEARFGWVALTEAYRGESDPQAKDGIAVAIAATADDSVLDELIALAKDASLGPSRLLLLRALERSRAPQAEMTLLGLQGDPDLAKEIAVILRRVKRKRERERARKATRGG